MSPYVLVTIRVFLYRNLGLSYLICMIAMLMIGFGIPYLFIKYVVRRNKLLSRILLGEW